MKNYFLLTTVLLLIFIISCSFEIRKEWADVDGQIVFEEERFHPGNISIYFVKNFQNGYKLFRVLNRSTFLGDANMIVITDSSGYKLTPYITLDRVNLLISSRDIFLGNRKYFIIWGGPVIFIDQDNMEIFKKVEASPGWLGFDVLYLRGEYLLVSFYRKSNRTYFQIWNKDLEQVGENFAVKQFALNELEKKCKGDSLREIQFVRY